MTGEDKAIAESVLRYLCIGCRVCGIHFYAAPILLIDTVQTPRLMRNILLTIESEWRIFDELPTVLPELRVSDDGVERRRTSELIATVAELAWNDIVEVQITPEIPHLLLTFDNGKVLYVNGHHDQFESWNISAGKFAVVATPGDGLATWHPDDFHIT